MAEMSNEWRDLSPTIDKTRKSNTELGKQDGGATNLQNARAEFIEWLSDINARMVKGGYLGAFEELCDSKLDMSLVGQEVSRIRARWQRAAFARAKQYAEMEWAWPNQLKEGQALIRLLQTWGLPDGISPNQVSELEKKLKEWKTNLGKIRADLDIQNNSFEHLVNPETLNEQKYDDALNTLLSEGYKFQVVELSSSTPPEQIAQFDIRALYNTRRYLQLIDQLKESDSKIENLVAQLGKKPTELKDKREQLDLSLTDVQSVNKHFAQIAHQLGDTNFKFDLDALQELNEKFPDAIAQAENVTTQFKTLQTTLNQLVPPHEGSHPQLIYAFQFVVKDLTALLNKIKDDLEKLRTETQRLRTAQKDASETQDSELAETIKSQAEELQKYLVLQSIVKGRQQIRRLDEQGQSEAEQCLTRAKELCQNLNLLKTFSTADLEQEIEWFKRVKYNPYFTQFKNALDSNQVETARNLFDEFKRRERDELGILGELLDAKSPMQSSQITSELEKRLKQMESRLDGLEKFHADYTNQKQLEQRERITRVAQALQNPLRNLKVPQSKETLHAALMESNALLESRKQYPDLPEWEQLQKALESVFETLCQSKWSQNLENLALARFIQDRYASLNTISVMR